MADKDYQNNVLNDEVHRLTALLEITQTPSTPSSPLPSLFYFSLILFLFNFYLFLFLFY